jgi:hypothetical protein
MKRDPCPLTQVMNRMAGQNVETRARQVWAADFANKNLDL